MRPLSDVNKTTHSWYNQPMMLLCSSQANLCHAVTSSSKRPIYEEFFTWTTTTKTDTDFQFQLIFISFFEKSSVHKFAINNLTGSEWTQLSWHETKPPHFSVMSKKKWEKNGWFLCLWHDLETINDNSTPHIAQDGWKIKLIYLKMLLYIYLYKKNSLNWPPSM